MMLFPLTAQPLGVSGTDDAAGPERFFDSRQTLLKQYANSPIIVALVDALGYAIDRQVDLDAFYDFVWNVDTAQGFGLDIWGRIVGASRAIYVPGGDYLGFSAATGADTFGHGVFWGFGSATPNYLLTDDAFRQVILAKAALNITDGSIPAINAILRALFPTYGNVYVQDNQNMTMTFVFSAAPSNIDYAIVTQAGVLPKPCGVSFSVVHP